MESIYLLTVRTLRQNKNRTGITIITIMLSVAMLTAVLNGSWCVLQYMREKAKLYYGDYAYSIRNINQEQVVQLEKSEDINSVALCTSVGSGFIGEKSNKSQVAIAGINETFIHNFSMEPYLESGRFPQNSSEIVVLSSFLQKNDLSLTVGDTITISVGARILDQLDGELYGLTNYMGELESFHEKMTKEYTIVGLLSDVDELKEPQMFNFFTSIDAKKQENEWTAYVKSEKISKAIYDEAKQNAKKVASEVYEYNDNLLQYYGVSDSAAMGKVLLALGVFVVLLMAASAAVIGNIMSISLQERLRQLGMLSSIGATKKQKRASVIFEAVFLGVIAIPLGLLLGVGLTAAVIAVIRSHFQTVVSFGTVVLKWNVHIGILGLSAVVGMIALALASIVPQKMAAKVTVMDVLRQTQIYQLNKNIHHKGKGVGLLFGIYGSLAAKNINRNPKRFRSVAVSIFLAVVMSLSLYSLSDFVVYISSMDMKEDGSCYVDVLSSVQYSERNDVIAKLAKEYPAADVACTYASYMIIDGSNGRINPNMSGYHIGQAQQAEIYVVGIDEAHMIALCEDRGINPQKYVSSSNYGILFNYATGEYNAGNNRICSGSPLHISAGETLPLAALNENAKSDVIVGDVIEKADAEIQSRFVSDRCVLVVPFSYYDEWLTANDDMVEMEINTKQHKEVTDYLTQMEYFMTFDQTQRTQSVRQIFLMVKLAVCIFSFMMTMIIGLSLCNMIANTIYVRTGEFAVLQSIGMTKRGLKKTLLLEAVLYGGKALLFALPISFGIHCAIYKVITMADTPFAFYINGFSYVIAVMAVAIIVIVAMLFSVRNLEKNVSSNKINT